MNQNFLIILIIIILIMLIILHRNLLKVVMIHPIETDFNIEKNYIFHELYNNLN